MLICIHNQVRFEADLNESDSVCVNVWGVKIRWMRTLTQLGADTHYIDLTVQTRTCAPKYTFYKPCIVKSIFDETSFCVVSKDFQFCKIVSSTLVDKDSGPKLQRHYHFLHKWCLFCYEMLQGEVPLSLTPRLMCVLCPYTVLYNSENYMTDLDHFNKVSG